MNDIKALFILSEQIKLFKKLSDPPSNYDRFETYETSIKQVLGGASNAVAKVKAYVEQVEAKLDELRNCPQTLVKKNQDAIEKIFGTFVPGEGGAIRKSALVKLEMAHKLQNLSKDITNDRLKELIQETEIVCSKLKDGTDVWYDDIDNLKGCLQSLRDAKAKSFEDEEKERSEEERRKAEEQQKRREEEERKRKEREEQERKEKEERERREREEAERKAEEERKRKEEEERMRKEEEERKKREEEERIRREEEEKKRRLEEERKRREEEAVRKKEEERQRLEAEKREKERLRKEAEERTWRRDPNNWDPVTYNRDCGEVDGKHAYHNGISCVMASAPGGIGKDDIECSASDEVDSIIEVLETDEKPVSSLIEIKSTKGTLKTEVPTRLCIPHYSLYSSSDETVVKVSLNGADWIIVTPLPTTSKMEEQEKLVKKLAGIDVNDFSSLKAIVVTRPRCQTIIVDRPGISVYSTMDKNVKLFVPRNAFETKTELKLMVQSVSDNSLSSFGKDNSELENILAVSPVLTLICGRHPKKAIEVDLIKSSQKQSNGQFQRGKTYQMYTSKDKVWKFADVEYKGHQDDLTMMLPPGREKYTVMELDMPSSFPEENVPQIAEALHVCINKTAVVMVAKQHENDLKKCEVRIIRRDILKETMIYLSENGYTEGPEPCAEFNLQEGQQLEIICTGNIDDELKTDTNVRLTYLSYIGGITGARSLRIKDTWKQKDLPAYVGTLRCTIFKNTASHDSSLSRSVELTISLPKVCFSDEPHVDDEADQKDQEEQGYRLHEEQGDKLHVEHKDRLHEEQGDRLQ
ncbi:FK506-binding protein 5-like [Ruditapes philippinarum]|uniref:FK506-binding protein 5-like n=1 Tax=Ruditapes philippinarum TaxID=129788 RepID=UPI00295AAF74|nr:FK506-binding protein 5-like [Ruditapes philippinarum]